MTVSVESMQYHLGGKRHQNAIKFWEERQKQAEISLFVRGYPIGTTEEELWEYFSQYGRVTKVTIVKPKVGFSHYSQVTKVTLVKPKIGFSHYGQVTLVKPKVGFSKYGQIYQSYHSEA